MQNCFVPADILLPGAATPLDPWACIAVDQFTSQPEYWQKAEELARVNPAPCTLFCRKLTLEPRRKNHALRRSVRPCRITAITC